MKVLYDYQIFQIQKFGGISRGLAEIISHFPSDIAYDIAIKESDNVYLKEYNLDNNHSPISYQFSDFLPNVSFKGKRRIYNILSQRGWINSSDSINLHHSIEKIKKEDYDVFHPTYFSTYFLKHIRKPFVLTVHDLTAENFPLYFNKFDYQKEGRKRLVPLASHIVVPSLSTKIDVMQNWNISEGRISVIYWGGVSVNNKKYPDSIGCPYI
ncbi:glycosyltransferase family 4 protein, partial [Bacteroides xylanisolvens]